MRIISIFIFQVMVLLPFASTWGQLHMAGFGASAGIFEASDLNISNTLIGGHAFIETPLGKYSFRGDATYLIHQGDKPSGTFNIDHLFNLHLGYGKVIGEGKRIQAPIFAAASVNYSKGNVELKSWGLGVRAGFRIFLGERLAFHIDGVGDYIFGNEVKYFNLQREESIINTKPILGQLNVGLMFMYNQKN